MRGLMVGWVLLALVVLIPVVVICIECLAAVLPARRKSESGAHTSGIMARPPVIVIIPAHDEQSVLGQTLTDLCAMKRAGDRLIVVADNCTDETVNVARGFSVEVIERHNLTQIGKGYALDFAARHLARSTVDASSVVIVVDADCGVSTGTLDALAAQVSRTGNPAQAVYTMASPEPPGTAAGLVSTLAFLLRNQVRPHGLNRLGLPCALTGSGMAFPWTTFRDAPLGNDCIVEDLKLGIDLVINHQPTRLCEGARITGTLPENRINATIQRTRWEHGHLRVALVNVPRLLIASVTSLRLAPLVAALDLAVPPLSLLIMLLCGASAAGLVWELIGQSTWPLRLLLMGDVSFVACLIAVWVAFGRAILPLSAFLAIPTYVIAKFPIYLMLLFRSERRWVKTPRDKVAAGTSNFASGSTVSGTANGRTPMEAAPHLTTSSGRTDRKMHATVP